MVRSMGPHLGSTSVGRPSLRAVSCQKLRWRALGSESGPSWTTVGLKQRGSTDVHARGCFVGPPGRPEWVGMLRLRAARAAFGRKVANGGGCPGRPFVTRIHPTRMAAIWSETCATRTNVSESVGFFRGANAFDPLRRTGLKFGRLCASGESRGRDGRAFANRRRGDQRAEWVRLSTSPLGPFGRCHGIPAARNGFARSVRAESHYIRPT